MKNSVNIAEIKELPRELRWALENGKIDNLKISWEGATLDNFAAMIKEEKEAEDTGKKRYNAIARKIIRQLVDGSTKKVNISIEECQEYIELHNSYGIASELDLPLIARTYVESACYKYKRINDVQGIQVLDGATTKATMWENVALTKMKNMLKHVYNVTKEVGAEYSTVNQQRRIWNDAQANPKALNKLEGIKAEPITMFTDMASILNGGSVAMLSETEAYLKIEELVQ